MGEPLECELRGCARPSDLEKGWVDVDGSEPVADAVGIRQVEKRHLEGAGHGRIFGDLIFNDRDSFWGWLFCQSL
jgi:hypothetical protein